MSEGKIIEQLNAEQKAAWDSVASEHIDYERVLSDVKKSMNGDSEPAEWFTSAIIYSDFLGRLKKAGLI